MTANSAGLSLPTDSLKSQGNMTANKDKSTFSSQSIPINHAQVVVKILTKICWTNLIVSLETGSGTRPLWAFTHKDVYSHQPSQSSTWWQIWTQIAHIKRQLEQQLESSSCTKHLNDRCLHRRDTPILLGEGKVGLARFLYTPPISTFTVSLSWLPLITRTQQC